MRATSDLRYMGLVALLSGCTAITDIDTAALAGVAASTSRQESVLPESSFVLCGAADVRASSALDESDLSEPFDRVQHDVLMGRLAKRIEDRRMLGLIRRDLNAGMLAKGITTERHEGTPPGGPLSPLLANVLLDEVDKDLEKRGHCFVRYADDNNVYVQTKRAGERVMLLLRRLYASLRLQVNESKSAVDLAWNRKILGYSFWVAPGRVIKRRVAGKARATMKEKSTSG